jgi:hypothetical protein
MEHSWLSPRPCLCGGDVIPAKAGIVPAQAGKGGGPFDGSRDSMRTYFSLELSIVSPEVQGLAPEGPRYSPIVNRYPNA